jgi:hypothetical protein
MKSDPCEINSVSYLSSDYRHLPVLADERADLEFVDDRGFHGCLAACARHLTLQHQARDADA